MKVGVEPGVIEGVCLPKSLLRLAGVQSSWPGQKASMGGRKLGRRVRWAGEIGRHARWRYFGVRSPRLCRDITCRAVLPPSVAVSLSLSPSVSPVLFMSSTLSLPCSPPLCPPSHLYLSGTHPERLADTDTTSPVSTGRGLSRAVADMGPLTAGWRLDMSTNTASILTVYVLLLQRDSPSPSRSPS